jgi:hypothetical protein
MNAARNLTRCALLATALTCGITTTALAQVLDPAFANDYALNVLPPVAGVTGARGGLTFRPGNPNKLLIVGQSAGSAAAIFEVDVTRNAGGHITGFAGVATLVATAPNADGGLQFGPGGVLFYTTWPDNMLGQIEPGSVAPDRLIDLTALGVASSTGGLAITPSGFPSAGSLKLTSYGGNTWYSATLVPDGTGTYDVMNLTLRATVGGFVGLEGIAHVAATYPAFSTPSALVCEWGSSGVSAYELDTNGDIDPSLQRTFLTSYSCTGTTVDPATGDLLFSGYSGTSMLVIEPSTVLLGTSYCTPAVPNSTGSSGGISATGSQAVAANNVTLEASSLPLNSFGFFLTSRTQGMVNQPGGSQGVLCLGGSIGRYVGPGQIQNSGASGSFSLVIDLAATPTPTGFVQVVAGETWNFQSWHRDAVGGTATSNFTDGLAIPFQ